METKLYALDLEQRVLASIIDYVETYDDHASSLHADLFYAERHKTILTAITSLKLQKMDCDYESVKQWLESHNKLETIGGVEYFFEMMSNSIKSRVSLGTWIKTLTELMLKRKAREIIKHADDMIEMNPDCKASEVINKAASDLLIACKPLEQNKTATLRDCLKELVADLDNKEIRGVTTGFYDLDKMLGVMESGDLVIVAARPSMGKTAIAVNILDHITYRLKKPCFMASLEMQKIQITRRMVSARAKVSGGALRERKLTESEWVRITPVIAMMQDEPLHINDTSSQTIQMIRTQALEVKRLHGDIGAVMIDYLGKMGGLGADNRNNAIGEITSKCKDLAKELGCPVILLSQLNRDVEKRPNKRPMMSDLRDSGSIEQDADVILMLYRDEYYYKEKSKFPGMAEVIVAKQRNGETGTVFLAFNGQYSTFSNYDGIVSEFEED
jgi:replicative DNA helicase